MPFVNIRVNVDLDQAGIQAVTDAGTCCGGQPSVRSHLKRWGRAFVYMHR